MCAAAWCSSAESELVKFLKTRHDLLTVPVEHVGQIVHVQVGLYVLQIIELVWRDTRGGGGAPEKLRVERGREWPPPVAEVD